MAAAISQFKAQFYAECKEITSLLATLQVTTATANADYESVSARTDTLHKYFTEQAAYLPQYEVRKAQEELTRLSRLAQEKRDQLFPKKRFGFRSGQKHAMTTLESTIESTRLAEAAKTSEARAAACAPRTGAAAAINTQSSCTIRDLDGSNGEQLSVVRSARDLSGQDVAVLNVRNACVQLYGNPSVLHVAGCANLVLLCGPITGAAFVSDCVDCELVLACHQLRVHDTRRARFYTSVGSRAIIENCAAVSFAPYAWSYGELEDHFAASGLARDADSWTRVDDFNWLSQEAASPHWSLLAEAERTRWTSDQITGQLTRHDAPVAPMAAVTTATAESSLEHPVKKPAPLPSTSDEPNEF